MRLNVLLLVTALACISSVSTLGCAFGEFRPNDPFQRQYALEEAQKVYTDSIRWGRYEDAQQFVDPEVRDEFNTLLKTLKSVRFSEWEADHWELDEELRETTIEVTYTGYSNRMPIEMKIHETQVWKRSGRGNAWSLRTSFRDLDRFASN
jgi:hypothetical protein